MCGVWQTGLLCTFGALIELSVINYCVFFRWKLAKYFFFEFVLVHWHLRGNLRIQMESTVQKWAENLSDSVATHSTTAGNNNCWHLPIEHGNVCFGKRPLCSSKENSNAKYFFRKLPKIKTRNWIELITKNICLRKFSSSNWAEWTFYYLRSKSKVVSWKYFFSRWCDQFVRIQWF